MKNDNNLNLHLKISKYFPKHKIIYYFLILIKFHLLIIFTHDWNINCKLGISYWIKKFTLRELIFDVDHIENLLSYSYYLFFYFSLFAFFLFFIKNKMRYNGKLFHLYRK